MPEKGAAQVEKKAKALERLVVRREEVDRLHVLLDRAALPVGALVERVGEIRAAVGPDPDIIRAVQELAAEVFLRREKIRK